MRLLLDTHIWVWSILEPTKLGKTVTKELTSGKAELWLSPISAWELLMLIERGRIDVEGDPQKWVAAALEAVPFKEAAITHSVATESRKLGFRHPDLADRFLAATALVYDLTLVTADKRLLRSKAFSVMSNR